MLFKAKSHRRFQHKRLKKVYPPTELNVNWRERGGPPVPNGTFGRAQRIRRGNYPKYAISGSPPLRSERIWSDS